VRHPEEAGIMDDDFDISEGGVLIERHDERKAPIRRAMGTLYLREITAHIEKHLGPVPNVFHDLVSELIHVDIYPVPPIADRPWWMLVTCGMSEAPMAIPQLDGGTRLGFTELCIGLPGSWPLDAKSLADSGNSWPLNLLATLARLPHEYESWVGAGHTFTNLEPPNFIASGTSFAGAQLAWPKLVSEDFHILEVEEGVEIDFLAVIPLYREELNLGLRVGQEALVRRLEDAGVNELLDVTRLNVGM
jgi:Suppressor of fused protein (SUFU)